jgi:hypothetical protein
MGQPPNAHSGRKPAKRHNNGKTLFIISGLGLLAFIGALVFSVIIGVSVVYGGGILPNVSVAGVNLGGLSESEAINTLQSQWTVITLRDGNRTWNVERDSLGINLDAQATAERAYQQGRGDGSPLSIIFGGAEVSPVITVNSGSLTTSPARRARTIAITPRGTTLVGRMGPFAMGSAD